MEILPLGDSAVLVRLLKNFETSPDDALGKVLGAKHTIESAQIPGVIEIAPAYATVSIFYDPVRAVEGGASAENVFGWMERQIKQALANAQNTSRELAARSLVDVPVCYEREFALDLEEVARHAGLPSKEVVDRHCSVEYRVHCVGFTPGFAYLGGLPGQLATPRKDIPRKEIPAGSVAIGGSQTGIYPIKSPGGWNVIGRTPLRLFDPKENPPAFFRAGDRVRFRAIMREEFERSIS